MAIVQRNLVQDDRLIGQTTQARLVDGGVKILQEAVIHIDTPYVIPKK